MKETPRRGVTAMSSLNEISTDQLGNSVVVRGEVHFDYVLPFIQQASGQIFKDDMNCFSSFSDTKNIMVYMVHFQMVEKKICRITLK